MAFEKNCGSPTSYGTMNLIEFLMRKGGQFGTAYLNADSDGFCGEWKIVIQKSEGGIIQFNDDEEAVLLMNRILADWQKKSEEAIRKEDDENKNKREALYRSFIEKHKECMKRGESIEFSLDMLKNTEGLLKENGIREDTIAFLKKCLDIAESELEKEKAETI